MIPPGQPFQVDYGFEFQFYGISCYITQVKREIFARVVQIEKRGLVMGDQTFGHVRESLKLPHNAFQAGDSPQYVVSVSVADLVMADGKSLEGTGVTPDIMVVPTQQDLAAGRDPVLAEALKILGRPMDAEQAGKLLGAN